MAFLHFDHTGQAILDKILGFGRSGIRQGSGKIVSVELVTTGLVPAAVWNTMSLVCVRPSGDTAIGLFKRVETQCPETSCVEWGPFRRFDQSGLLKPITTPGVHLMHTSGVSKKLELVST